MILFKKKRLSFDSYRQVGLQWTFSTGEILKKKQLNIVTDFLIFTFFQPYKSACPSCVNSKIYGLDNMSQSTPWVTSISSLVAFALYMLASWVGRQCSTHVQVNSSKGTQYLRNLSKSSLLHWDHDTSPRFCPLIHSPDMIWRPSAHDGWSLSWLIPMLIQNIIETKKIYIEKMLLLHFQNCNWII